MSKPKEIEIDGVKYIPKDEATKQPLETSHVIIIAQRGWIFIGDKNDDVTDKIQLLNASVVRSWSNGRGIGGLTKEQYKSEYKLDEVGQISFPPEAIVAELAVEW